MVAGPRLRCQGRGACSAPAGSAPLPPRSGRKRWRSAPPAPCGGRRAGAVLSRHGGAALARRHAGRAVALLGRRRTRQRLRRPARGFSDLVPVGEPRAACGGRRARVEAAAAKHAASLCIVRRRRHLEGRLLRGAQHRRRLAAAGGFRWSTTTNGRSPCRARRRRAAETLAQKAVAAGIPGEQVDGNDVLAVRAGGAAPLSGARRRRRQPDRGADLPPRRPHHRRRCQPLSRRCGGQPALARRALAAPARVSGRARALEPRGGGTTAAGDVPPKIDARGGRVSRHAAADRCRRSSITSFAELPAALAQPAGARRSRAEPAAMPRERRQPGRGHQPRARPGHAGRPRVSSSWARMSATTAACSAPPTGCWRASGQTRVLDTPLAEAAIAGISVGLAAQGFRPVAEIQFMGFTYADDRPVAEPRGAAAHAHARPAHLPDGAAHALRRRHPRARAPLRERRGDACTNIPGLRVVIPSSPQRGLWPAAGGDPRSRSGGLPRADAALPRRRASRSWTTAGAAARPLLHAARRAATSRWSPGAR